MRRRRKKNKYNGLSRIHGAVMSLLPFGGVGVDEGVDNSHITDYHIDVLVANPMAYLYDTEGRVLAALKIPEYRAKDLRAYTGDDYNKTYIWVRDYLLYLAGITQGLNTGLPKHCQLTPKEDLKWQQYRTKNSSNLEFFFRAFVALGRKEERDKLIEEAYNYALTNNQ